MRFAASIRPPAAGHAHCCSAGASGTAAPHWVHECVYLGRDEWGDWFGQLAGWRSSRPERDYLVERAERHAHAARAATTR